METVGLDRACGEVDVCLGVVGIGRGRPGGFGLAGVGRSRATRFDEDATFRPLSCSARIRSAMLPPGLTRGPSSGLVLSVL